jgi:hypothetical protein
MVVGLATTLATANVLMHNAALHRPAAPPTVEPAAPASEPVSKPIARAKPPVEVSRSLIVATRRHRDID